jgi:DNA modification methylase
VSTAKHSTADWINKIHVGDCRELMRAMIADGVRVQCIVTSPPYWGLRDYGVAGQFGLERTWIRHVARMRSVFRLCSQLLADDGVLWLNYGDSYHSSRPCGDVGHNSTINGQRSQEEFRKASRFGPNRRLQRGLKPKDLVGMPWRVAFALQSDGWYLRSDNIWHKPNPMPESVTDRPTKAHEYVFLLSKSERYFYDQKAIREPVTGNAHARGDGVNPKALAKVSGWGQGAGVSHDTIKHAAATDSPQKFRGTGVGFGHGYDKELKPRTKQNESFSAAVNELVDDRNARTVWSIPTEGFKAAHFATFPQALVRRCILAGSKPGDIIFDPFMGSGTVAEVSLSLGRSFIGCEINSDYAEMFSQHRSTQQGLSI